MFPWEMAIPFSLGVCENPESVKVPESKPQIIEL